MTALSDKVNHTPWWWDSRPDQVGGEKTRPAFQRVKKTRDTQGLAEDLAYVHSMLNALGISLPRCLTLGLTDTNIRY